MINPSCRSSVVETHVLYDGDQVAWLVSVQRTTELSVMVFVAPQSHFERLKPTYQAMLQSVQFSVCTTS